jgi:hypothetical protein
MSATDPTPATTPPTCDQDHNGFQTCRGPEDGCYALEGVYAEDARYIYPAREEWYRASLKNEHDRANAYRDALERITKTGHLHPFGVWQDGCGRCLAVAALSPEASPSSELPEGFLEVLRDESVVLPGEKEAWQSVLQWVQKNSPEGVTIYENVPKDTLDIAPGASPSSDAPSVRDLCERCNGRAEVASFGDAIPCPDCNGSGRAPTPPPTQETD